MCCEDPATCLLPPGTNGQICPKSPGKLCDFCNPMNPECNEGKCIVTSNNETYCGKSCGNSQGCPPSYTCMSLKIKNTYTSQCVPNDKSCFQ
jgi:hypothetical protein